MKKKINEKDTNIKSKEYSLKNYFDKNKIYTLKDVEKIENKEYWKLIDDFLNYETNQTALCFINRCNKLLLNILNKKTSLKDFKLITINIYTNSGIYGGSTQNKEYSDCYFYFYMKYGFSYFIFKEDFEYFKSLYTVGGVKKTVEKIKTESFENAKETISDAGLNVDYKVEKEKIDSNDMGGQKISKN